MVYVINGEQLLYRKKVTINGSMVTIETGIPLARNIVLPGVKSDGSDVRLAHLNGTPIAREIECVGVPSTDAVMIHYPFNTVAGNNSQFYVYWGNAGLNEPAADSTYGSEAVWSSGYKLVALMNNDPNGDVAGSIKDSTSNGNHGTPSGTMTTADLVDTAYNRAIDFDGGDDEISTGTSNFPTGAATRTSMVRFRFDGGGLDAFCGYGDTSNYTGFYMTITDDTTISIDNFGNGGNITVSSLGTTLYHTVHFVFDGTDTLAYLDGSYIGTFLGSAVPINSGLGRGSHIAVRRYSDGNYYNYYDGDIVEVQHSTGEHSANYISTTHKNLNNPTSSGTDPFYLADGIVEHQRRHPQFI